MKVLTNDLTVRREQGFEIFALKNEIVKLEIVPELGAKIISLKNLRSGREWLWRPPNGLRLFRNREGDDFSKSPLAGIDECFPTIAPCRWRERELPDHGELWNAPWDVDVPALENEILQTRVKLKISPFEFERSIELQENEIQIRYQINNRGDAEENFLWSLHPLLQLQIGDELELPASTRALFNGANWIDSIASAIPQKKFAKIFAAPVREGFAAICNSGSGERLEFEWSPDENCALGLWLTRGGWHGHHHFAIEPTNAAHDSLADVSKQKYFGKVAAFDSVNWQICLRVF